MILNGRAEMMEQPSLTGERKLWIYWSRIMMRAQPAVLGARDQQLSSDIGASVRLGTRR